VTVRFQLRRDTSSNWSLINPTLAPGEPGVETDTLKLKIGTGVTEWNSLGYTTTTQFSDLQNKPTTLDGYGITDAAKLESFSVTIATANGNGNLTYDSATGEFVFTPPELIFSNISNTPTTLSGYGITDAATAAQGSLADTAIQPGNDAELNTVTTNSIDTADSSALTIETDVEMLAGLTVGNHIIPSSNKNIDLGSETARFRDIYLSGNTIDLGGTAISRDAAGNMQIRDKLSGQLQKVVAREFEISNNGIDRVRITQNNDGSVKFQQIDNENTELDIGLGLERNTTDDLAEGSNLYYTDSRVDTRFGTKTTDDLSEGSNLYYTDGRVDARFGTKTTDDLAEGSNLYYTDGRVDQHLTGGVGITYTSGTITNTAPDQTVVLNEGDNVTVTGTYPNFTVAATDTNTTYTAGAGLLLNGTEFSNTAPDQTVVISEGDNITVTGTYPNFTIASTDTNTTYTAGAGLLLNGTEFSNTAPDQTVVLNEGDNITVTGTYPNFTVAATGDLIATNNLSDLDNPNTAIENLGITATATELNYVDGVTSPIQTQFDNISVTKGTLTKSFASGETASISLSQAITAGAPVVTVIKEVPQEDFTTSTWDVATDGSNYDRHDTAYNTTLTSIPVGFIPIDQASYNSVNLYILPQEDTPQAITFNNDGTKMYIVGLQRERVYQYTLSTAFDIRTASVTESFSIADQESQPTGLAFNSTGTRMYIIGVNRDRIRQYTLTTAFDLSTASYSGANADVSGQGGSPTGLAFNNDDSKMYTVDSSTARVREYFFFPGTTSVSLNYFGVNLDVFSQTSSPEDITFNNDGTKMYIIGDGRVYQYTLSTAFNLSTASYDSLSFRVSDQEFQPTGIAFDKYGTRMYVLGNIEGRVYQYSTSEDFELLELGTGSFDAADVGKTIEGNGGEVVLTTVDGRYNLVTAFNDTNTIAAGDWGMFGTVFDETNGLEISGSGTIRPTSTYHVAVTNTNGQINSINWLDINSMTTDQINGLGEIYYAVSTDNRTSWSVIDDTNGVRPVVRDNAGTWEYNSNATYGSVTWTAATTNEELYALQEAFGDNAANRMDKTQLEAVTDPNHYSLGDSLDLAISLYLGSESSNIPSSNGVLINYDANVLNKGAIHGTDYDWDFPDSTTVRLTSNAAQNLKIRIV